MKYFTLLLITSFIVVGCNKEKYNREHIQHKWQHTSDDFEFTDGTTDFSFTYDDTNTQYWSFNNGLIEKIYTSGNTSYTYTIDNKELKTEGQGNLSGWKDTYTIKTVSNDKMILLYDLTNNSGEKNGEMNMNFKKAD